MRSVTMWKATHPPLPENYELSLRRLQGLLSRLREKPEYDSVIKDQIERGIVEVVNEETKPDVVQSLITLLSDETRQLQS